MKKKHFYSMWAKTLTTAVLLVAGGLTGRLRRMVRSGII